MKKYLSLLRVKHYIKNFLIFLPLIFSGAFFSNINLLFLTIIEFLSFSFIASSVYIFNDLIDYEKDKIHPIKKHRAIASGQISKNKAKIIFVILIILSLLIQTGLFYFNVLGIKHFAISTGILLGYLILNLCYTKWLKNMAIIDIIVLAFGFILRVFYGGAFSGIEISNWLYLTILAFSLYLVVGKRRGELIKNKDNSRPVLKYYSKEFLDKFMYVFLALTLVFYSLWCIQGVTNNNFLIYSIFLVIFIVMKYSLIIEGDSLADPVDVIWNDKVLIIAVLLYAIFMGVILYG